LETSKLQVSSPFGAQIRIAEERWKRRKTSLDGAKENRQDAYATLFSGLLSDLSEPSFELSPWTPSGTATA
jgi:hypothetical protein